MHSESVHSPFNISAVFSQITNLLYILLFVYAAANKLLDQEKFLVQLGQSPVLASHAEWITWAIPAIEIIIAILLCFEATNIGALYAAQGLMVIFTAYILVIMNFTEYIPCSCGGILEKMGWGQHLIFNICFVILGTVAILVSDKKG